MWNLYILVNGSCFGGRGDGEIAQSVASLSELFQPVLTTGSKNVVHASLCLCNDACKRSLAICRKSRASCPVSRLLSVPIWPACAKQGR